MVSAGVAAMTSRKRLRAWRGEAAYIPLDLASGCEQSSPWAAPGWLIAAKLTYLSHRQGVPPCLRTSHLLSGTLGVNRTTWRMPLPRHACGVFWVVWFRGA